MLHKHIAYLLAVLLLCFSFFAQAQTDTTPPEVASITRIDNANDPLPEFTNANTLIWGVVFNEAVLNVDPADFAASGTTENPSSVALLGGVYQVTLSGGDLAGLNAEVRLSIVAGHNIEDMAGNDLAVLTPTGVNQSYMVDNARPQLIEITRMTTPVGPNGETNADTLTWAVVFDEPVNNVSPDDFKVNGTSAMPTVTMGMNGDASYQVTASGGNLSSLNDTVSLSLVLAALPANRIADRAGNRLEILTPAIDPITMMPGANESYMVDNTRPNIDVFKAIDALTSDNTPEYIFESGEAGAILYGGSCTRTPSPIPATLNAVVGSTTITYGLLMDGEYRDCTIVVTDAAGNTSNPPLAVDPFTIDTTPPEVQSITRMTPPTPPAGPNGETNENILTWSVVFNEDVTNVDAADFDVINTTATLAVTPTADASRYEVEVSGGNLSSLNDTVSLSIFAGHDIDDLIGNDLTNLTPAIDPITMMPGANESYIVDNIAPEVASITRMTPPTPPAGPNGETNEDILTWAVAFDGEVRNVDMTDFMLTGLSPLGATIDVSSVMLAVVGSGSSYEVTASGGNLDLIDFIGTVSLSIATGHNIDDRAGNDLAVLAPPNPESYEVDNIAPDISVVTAIDASTNDVTPEYVFHSDEAGDITVDGVCSIAPTRAIVGNNSISFNTLAEGLHTNCMVTVTDAAGNSDTLTVPDFTVDITAPTVGSIRLMDPSNALTNSGTLTWSVVFNEPVNNVDGRDFAVSGATGTTTVTMGMDGDTSYQVRASMGNLMDFDGTVSLSIISTGVSIMDLARNPLTNTAPIDPNTGMPGANESYALENMEPTVASISRIDSTGMPLPEVTNSGTLTWSVAFSEGVNNVDMTDFAVSNTTAAITVAGSDGDTSYEVTASGGDLPTLNGTVTLSIDVANDIADLAGNTLAALAPPNPQSYRVDNKRPIVSEVTAIGGISTLTDDATPEYVFRSDEAGAISYGGACSSQTGTATAMIDTTITFHQELAGTFEPLPEGDYTDCTITVTDAAGNISAESPVTAFTVDTIPAVETIVATTAAGSHGIGDMIAIEVTFSEVVVVTGTPVLSLNNNGGQAVYSSGSGSSTLTFSYTVSPRQGSADLEYSGTDALSLAGGTINDDDTPRNADGNPAILRLPDPGTDGLRNDGSVISISAPGVEQVSGISNNYRTGDIVTINVQFSEPVTVSGGGQLQLELETGDIDRMAVLSGTPTITSNILELTYMVEEGDKSRDLAYTAIDALVEAGASVTSTTGEVTDLILPALGSSGSLSGSSDIIVGIVIEEQNARLNEILLPKIAQVMSAATVEAITRRIEAGGSDEQAVASSSLSSILPTGLPALKDMNLSWLKSFAYDFLITKAEQSARSGSINLDGILGSGFDIKRVLGNSEFVMPLNASGDGTGSGATSSMVLWGSGDYNNLSDNDDGLDYDGDIYSINVGIDSQISQETLLGISVNWSNANFDYRDATTVQTGDYGYKLYGINPYISWSPQGLGGSNLWATVGYGIGEIESQIDGIEKVETDTRQYQFSGGGRYILTSSADSLSQLSIKGDLTLLRVDIDRSVGFLGNDIDSQSFRLLLQGSSVFNHDGYSFTPSLEGGLRYDLGDGDTGGGIELSPAFTYKSLDDHILIEGRGRYLIAGQHDQWGLSVLARIDQARHGRGLSFSMHPTWGQSQAQAQQLTAHNGSRFNDYRAAKAEAQMKTELSYGMHMSHILGQTMLFTPYAEFTLGENARYYQFGQRLSIGELLSLSFKLSHHQRRGYADDSHLGLESAINF